MINFTCMANLLGNDIEYTPTDSSEEELINEVFFLVYSGIGDNTECYNWLWKHKTDLGSSPAEFLQVNQGIYSLWVYTGSKFGTRTKAE